MKEKKPLLELVVQKKTSRKKKKKREETRKMQIKIEETGKTSKNVFFFLE